MEECQGRVSVYLERCLDGLHGFSKRLLDEVDQSLRDDRTGSVGHSDSRTIDCCGQEDIDNFDRVD